MLHHNYDVDDPLSALDLWESPRSSARLNHKHLSFITTGMNCACGISVLGIFFTVGTRLCHQKSFTARSLSCVSENCRGLPHDSRLRNLLNPSTFSPSPCTASVDLSVAF